LITKSKCLLAMQQIVSWFGASCKRRIARQAMTESSNTIIRNVHKAGSHSPPELPSTSRNKRSKRRRSSILATPLGRHGRFRCWSSRMPDTAWRAENRLDFSSVVQATRSPFLHCNGLHLDRAWRMWLGGQIRRYVTCRQVLVLYARLSCAIMPCHAMETVLPCRHTLITPATSAANYSPPPTIRNLAVDTKESTRAPASLGLDQRWTVTP
jgi:hypothetical protein